MAYIKNTLFHSISGTSPYQNFVKNPEVQDMGLSASSSAAVGGSVPILTSSATALATASGFAVSSMSSLLLLLLLLLFWCQARTVFLLN